MVKVKLNVELEMEEWEGTKLELAEIFANNIVGQEFDYVTVKYRGKEV